MDQVSLKIKWEFIKKLDYIVFFLVGWLNELSVVAQATYFDEQASHRPKVLPQIASLPRRYIGIS